MVSLTNSFSYQNLTLAEKRAYDDYKMDPYELNQKLRSKMSLSDSEKKQTTTLDSIIHRFTCSQDVVLYRACCSDCVDAFIKGNFYTYPAYMSTATSISGTRRHSQCDNPSSYAFLEIYCPMGTHMLPLDDNTTFGHPESEVLLSRNLLWEITCTKVATANDIDKILGKFYGKDVKKLTIYKMSIVADKHLL